MSEVDPDGRLAASPSSVGVRHPRALVLGERATGAANAGPYAAREKQQGKTQSEYLHCHAGDRLVPTRPQDRKRRRQDGSSDTPANDVDLVGA